MSTGVMTLPKKDYWSNPEVLEQHAAKRRRKYADDPDYAKREKARQRAIYLQRKGVERSNAARAAVPHLDPEASYSATDLSLLLHRRPAYINGLITKGLWPDPRGGKAGMVRFSGAQAVRLFEAFAVHLDEVTTYRQDHTDTRDRLFAAMENDNG